MANGLLKKEFIFGTAGVLIAAGFLGDMFHFKRNAEAQTRQAPYELSGEKVVQDIAEICETSGGVLQVNNIGGADCLFDRNASTDLFLSALEAKGYDVSGSGLSYYSIEGPDDTAGVCAMVGRNNVGPAPINQAKRFGSGCG